MRRHGWFFECPSLARWAGPRESARNRQRRTNRAHHSWTFSAMQRRPKPFAQASFGSCGRASVARSSNAGWPEASGPGQGHSRPSKPPRAAYSRSASVGSRNGIAVSPASQSQYATASCQLTPTTGCPGAANRSSPTNCAGGALVAATKRAYSALFTGLTAARNGATDTRCAGCSSGGQHRCP